MPAANGPFCTTQETMGNQCLVFSSGNRLIPRDSERDFATIHWILPPCRNLGNGRSPVSISLCPLPRGFKYLLVVGFTGNSIPTDIFFAHFSPDDADAGSIQGLEQQQPLPPESGTWPEADFGRWARLGFAICFLVSALVF